MLAVGIIGATVMPHSLFLGSALATQDRVNAKAEDGSAVEEEDSFEAAEDVYRGSGFGGYVRSIPYRAKEYVVWAFRVPPPSAYATKARRHSERENNSLKFVKAHITHGIIDVAVSLLGFAVVINSLFVLFPLTSRTNADTWLFSRIMIIAGGVFFYGSTPTDSNSDPASLFDAYELIRELIGQGETYSLPYEMPLNN